MRLLNWYSLFMAGIALSLQIIAADSEVEEMSVEDVHTQSNFNDVSVEHMFMDLVLDMEKQFFSGSVELAISNDTNSDQLVLDTNGLIIHAAAISDNGRDFESANFELGAQHEVLGRALTININPGTKFVRIEYETTKDSKGIDWVDPKLTRDGFPMVVTQFQAINARGLVPSQDTPANKITYDANIKLKSSITDPRLRVVMAAIERECVGDREFAFKMTLPIPTYLIALAAGVFEEKPISDRVSVIAEPSVVDRAHQEFADAENMVVAAEEMFGAYAWGRFDIFIMPPSFSYGGMENPTMTFIGPTVVAGDKSLVGVVAHELAHSWSGNWVTNMNWDEFWINEGTTMYLQRLIQQKLYGSEFRKLDILVGQIVLKDNIEKILSKAGPGADLTRLKTNLAADFDPDDAVTHVPYEKGFNFWLALEQAYGQPAVIAFLKEYFQKYSLGTMNSATLKKLIVAYGPFEGATKVDIDDWFYGAGYPKAGLPVIESDLARNVEHAISFMNIAVGANAIEEISDKFDANQWCYFLRTAKKTTEQKLLALNQHFKLSSKNDEVRFNFYVFAIRSGAFASFKEEIDSYLQGVGRIKYVGPIYEALVEKGLKDAALVLFEKHKWHNNHITNGSIARNLQ